MRRVFLWLLVAALIAFGLSSAKAQYCYTTVMLDEGVATGSGCLIAPDLVITASHCVVGGDFHVEFGRRLFTGKVIGVDSKADCAIVRLDRRVYGVRPLRVGVAHIGEQVFIGGYGGEKNTFLWKKGTIISRWQNQHGGSATMVSREPRHGDSGGPVLNTDGELVGVIWAINSEYKDGDGDAVGFCHEFIQLLRETVPEYKGIAKYAKVDPYFETRKLIGAHGAINQLKGQIALLEMHMNSNGVPTPALIPPTK